MSTFDDSMYNQPGQGGYLSDEYLRKYSQHEQKLKAEQRLAMEAQKNQYLSQMNNAIGNMGMGGSSIHGSSIQQGYLSGGPRPDYLIISPEETRLCEFALGRCSAKFRYTNIAYLDDLDHAVEMYGEKIRTPIIMLQTAAAEEIDAVVAIPGSGSVRKLRDGTYYMRIAI